MGIQVDLRNNQISELPRNKTLQYLQGGGSLEKKDNEDSDSTAEMETSNAEENLNDESDSPVADRETGNPEEDSGNDSDSTIAAENNDL